ncbi:MAG: diadenylate cyclase CdaA [Candidatus Dormibacteraeota bacterium]|nr:diadenylate cyclase CdaA [Candidatus Dormibacteraeota bacterium]
MSSPWRDALIFLQNIGWRDVLDVVIVAVLLYQLLKLIRGTQAAQLAVGLGVIIAVGLAAEALHLRLLQFIFANGGQAIVIAAVILFQPELRRALDQVGRLGPVRSLLGQHAGADAQRSIDEVIRAASSLSERKTGGLIVFEHETGLENIATTGVRINGEVSAEMLATIFMPGTSLHDGAVIIREARLVAAGCVLPLAETIPGVGRMGTRHRAAVGLTLQSDATVLIVSEETGLISVAHEGRIIRGLDAKTLRTTLMAMTGADAPQRQGLMPRPSALRAIRRRTHP